MCWHFPVVSSPICTILFQHVPDVCFSGDWRALGCEVFLILYYLLDSPRFTRCSVSWIMQRQFIAIRTKIESAVQMINVRLDALLDNDKDQFFGDAPDAEAFLGRTRFYSWNIESIKFHDHNQFLWDTWATTAVNPSNAWWLLSARLCLRRAFGVDAALMPGRGLPLNFIQLPYTESPRFFQIWKSSSRLFPGEIKRRWWATSRRWSIASVTTVLIAIKRLTGWHK